MKKKKFISTLMCLLICTAIGSQGTVMAVEEENVQTYDDVLTSDIDYSTHDLTLLYLGESVYVQLYEDSQTYNAKTYYLEVGDYNVGDIVGINLNSDNVESRDYVKNFILESSYTTELIQSCEPKAFTDDEVLVIFATIDFVYNQHCVKVTPHQSSSTDDSFYIFTEEPLPDDYSRGTSIIFTTDELYTSENVPLIKSDFVADAGYINGISCGYNSNIDATVINVASSKDDNIGNYVYLYGIDIDAGYNTSFFYLEPFVFVEDNLYIADFYELSNISDSLMLEKDTSQLTYKTAEVLGRYTDNGAYVKLTDSDYSSAYIYLVDGVSEDVEVGDLISFDLLNAVSEYQFCVSYYADNVSIVEKYSKDILLGDVNLDGSVDILDLLTLKNALVKNYSNDLDALPENANINKDLSIDTMDLFLLKRIILDLV